MRVVSGVLFLAGLAILTFISSGVAADDFKLEPGFTSFFNGKDLSGWVHAPKKADKSPLEGKTETPDKRFKVADGMIVIDTKAKGDVVINSTKEFGKDVHIKFDYLPGTGCNNDLYLRGLKFDIKKADVKNLKEGEWNTFEIVVTGDKAEFKNNGESLKTGKAAAGATPLGVRAEAGPCQYRHFRFKE